MIYIAKAIQNKPLLKVALMTCKGVTYAEPPPPKKPQRAAVMLTVGGLQSLSLYVKSSYRTTPKLQMSDATENLLSVRDSGAYLSQRTKIQLPNEHKHIISCHSNLYEHLLCLNKSYGFE